MRALLLSKIRINKKGRLFIISAFVFIFFTNFDYSDKGEECIKNEIENLGFSFSFDKDEMKKLKPKQYLLQDRMGVGGAADSLINLTYKFFDTKSKQERIVVTIFSYRNSYIPMMTKTRLTKSVDEGEDSVLLDLLYSKGTCTYVFHENNTYIIEVHSRNKKDILIKLENSLVTKCEFLSAHFW